MKPTTCLIPSCNGNENCSMCINRNSIAKKGYELIQIIEKIPASIEQTEAVTATQDYMNLCLKLFEDKNEKEY